MSRHKATSDLWWKNAVVYCLDVRAPMRWSGDRHAGFSQAADAAALCRPLTEGDPAQVEGQRRDPDSFLNRMERLIRRRKECPELGWGEWTLLETGSPAVLAHRTDWDGRILLAVHNLSADAVDVEVSLGDDGRQLVDLFGHDDRPVEGGRVALSTGRYGFAWYHVRR